MVGHPHGPSLFFTGVNRIHSSSQASSSHCRSSPASSSFSIGIHASPQPCSSSYKWEYSSGHSIISDSMSLWAHPFGSRFSTSQNHKKNHGFGPSSHTSSSDLLSSNSTTASSWVTRGLMPSLGNEGTWPPMSCPFTLSGNTLSLRLHIQNGECISGLPPGGSNSHVSSDSSHAFDSPSGRSSSVSGSSIFGYG